MCRCEGLFAQARATAVAGSKERLFLHRGHTEGPTPRSPAFRAAHETAWHPRLAPTWTTSTPPSPPPQAMRPVRLLPGPDPPAGKERPRARGTEPPAPEQSAGEAVICWVSGWTLDGAAVPKSNQDAAVQPQTRLEMEDFSDLSRPNLVQPSYSTFLYYQREKKIKNFQKWIEYLNELLFNHHPASKNLYSILSYLHLGPLSPIVYFFKKIPDILLFYS